MFNHAVLEVLQEIVTCWQEQRDSEGCNLYDDELFELVQNLPVVELSRIAVEHEDPEFRAAACTALGALSWEETNDLQPALSAIYTCCHDEEDWVRVMAHWAMWEIDPFGAGIFALWKAVKILAHKKMSSGHYQPHLL